MCMVGALQAQSVILLTWRAEGYRGGLRYFASGDERVAATVHSLLQNPAHRTLYD